MLATVLRPVWTPYFQTIESILKPRQFLTYLLNKWQYGSYFKEYISPHIIVLCTYKGGLNN
jgi:hypothetical protein